MKRRCRRRVPSSTVVPAEHSEGRDPYSATYRESRDYGSLLSRGRQTSLPLYPGKIRHRAGGFADLVEQLEAVFTQGLVVHVDVDLVKKSVDEGPQPRQVAHCAFEVFGFYRTFRRYFGPTYLVCERLFFGKLIKVSDRSTGVVRVVLLLFDAQDVGGALDPGEQVLAVVAIEEFPERRDAAHDHEQIVLAFECEHGIHKVMPRALLAQLHLEAVREEGEEIK